MSKKHNLVFLVAGVLFFGVLASSAFAQQMELRHDGFEAGGAAAFQSVFVAGDIGAVRFDLDETGPYQLLKVTLLFGGSTSEQTIKLHVWDDAGQVEPDAELFVGDYALTGSNDSFAQLDLSSEAIEVQDSFRIGIEFQHAGFPSIARDDDGTILESHNFVYVSIAELAPAWYQSSTALGTSGDWIIRATVEKVAEGPDAGPVTVDAGPAPPDAGPSGADAGSDVADAGSGAADAGTGTECNDNGQCANGGGGGCSSTTVGLGTLGCMLFLALLALSALVDRYRSAKRSQREKAP